MMSRPTYIIGRIMHEVHLVNLLKSVFYASMQIVRQQVKLIIVEPDHHSKLYCVGLSFTLWVVP